MVEFELCSDVRHRTVGDECVVLRQEAAEVLVVNDVGARIIEFLASGQSSTRLVGALASEYDVDRETLDKDVSDFLSELASCGVINPVGSDGV